MNKENNNQGLPPEKVEELMKWIRDAEKECTKLSHSIIFGAVERKIESLLSSPQPEKEGAIGSVYGQRELKNLVVSTFCEKCRQPSCICNKTSIVTSQQVSEGEITEENFEAIIHQSINTCGNKECDCPKDICKEESEGGKQCFSLAQRMVSQALATKDEEIRGLREAIDKLQVTHQHEIKKLERTVFDRTPSISIEEAKDRVAKEDGYKDWIEFRDAAGRFSREHCEKLINKAMLLYAQHSTPVTQEGETLYEQIPIEKGFPNQIGKRFFVITKISGFETAFCAWKNKKKGEKAFYQSEPDSSWREIKVTYYLQQLPSTPPAGQEEKK